MALEQSTEKTYVGLRESCIEPLITKLRKLSYIKNSTFIAIIENNLAMSANSIANILYKFNIWPFYESQDKVGVRKGKNVEQYSSDFETANIQKRIRFDSNFFSITHDTPKIAREELCEQGLRFGYDEKGKLHGKYGNECDDLWISFIQGIFWITLIYSHDLYRSQLEQAEQHFDIQLPCGKPTELW